MGDETVRERRAEVVPGGGAGTSPEQPPVGAPATPTIPAQEPAENWETRFKYLLADFENFRRRAEREREAITRQSRAALLHELLPLVEAFRSARDSSDHLPPTDPLRRGIELLDREWSKFLKHEGIEPVATLGTRFRAEEAEAVGEALPSDVAPDGTVAEIVQQGYRFFGGLLRPAKVVVARARPPPGAARAADEGADTPGGAGS